MSAALIVAAPLRGWVAPLAEAPDPVFAQGMMGDGVALHPLDDRVRAPFAGEVVTLQAAGHAVTLRADNGVEVLIHIGLDTVALGGTGFTPLVAIGDRVATGTALIRFDADMVAQAVPSLVTPVVVTSGHRVLHRASGRVAAGEPLFEIGDAPDRAAPDTAGERASGEVTLAFAHGIHARPAATIGARAREFAAAVTIVAGEKRADARSVTGLLALGTQHGDTLRVEAHGADAPNALAAIVDLLATDLDAGAARAPAQLNARAASAPLQAGEIAGVTAVPGLAIGPAFRIAQSDRAVAREGGGIAQERAALAGAIAALRADVATRGAEGTVADIMRAHLGLLDDPALTDAAERGIAAGESAAYAWRKATRAQVDALRAGGNAHLAARADDLIDVERQLLALLAGDETGAPIVPAGAIIVADDLLPSQLIALAASGPAGVALVRGGPTSHVAILCAGLGLPALVAIGAALDEVADGTTLLLDADAGCLTPDPSASATTAFAARVADRSARRDAARAEATTACRTADDVRIEVVANIASVADAATAAREGAEGAGLVRSEFLFLGRDAAPSVEEQRVTYQAIVDALPGPIIIRLLDIGGDKPAAYLPIAPEENPALGLRGIRVGLAHPDLLEAQLRAILSVAPARRCRIMVPMVTGIGELRVVRGMVDRLAGELAVSAPEVGVMVETPAAAITADLLACEADFFSIGSNDLTQYVLAMDRGNATVAGGVDALHPAVLRMIARTCEGAARHGRWVGVCGGLASDPLALAILVGLGVIELSCVPSLVAEAKAIVRSFTLPDARTLATRALECADAAEVRSLAIDFAERTA